MFANEYPLSVALKDIPDNKIKQLSKRGFETVADLINFLPRRYEDRSRVIHDFSQLSTFIGVKSCVVGKVTGVYTNHIKQYLSVNIVDQHDEKMTITWYHQNYLSAKFIKDREYIFYGRVDYNPKFGYSISSPGYYDTNTDKALTPLPVYGKVPGMSSEYLSDCIKTALAFHQNFDCEDPIPQFFREKLNLIEANEFYHKAHDPQNMGDIDMVNRRKNAEILIPFVGALAEKKYEVKMVTDCVVKPVMAKTALFQFKATLPYKLTADQEKTLVEMCEAVTTGKRLDALVQGDVGCGKTMVAAGMTAVLCAGGYQVAIMAPTTILASQHYEEFKKLFEKAKLRVAFLGGKEKVKEKRAILDGIKEGNYDIIIGTSAVISRNVEYKALGLTIVDEEHRFGVVQRDMLRERAKAGAHSISMSATPIPRSIALAMYGEATTIYNIHTMPAGRKPIQTIVFSDEEKTYEALYRQVKKGRQGYVICPLITANETIEDVESLEDTFEKMKKYFTKYPEVKIGCINGKMKAEDVQSEIHKFAGKEYNILLSTTIVEVGVNVPNATVMVVKNAERFGMAQLHQLRGRVGRGSEQSFCVLLSKDKANVRLQTMARTNDGFEIAQADLEQRGTGNLTGVEQKGFDKAVNTMLANRDLYDIISKEFDTIMRGKLLYNNAKRMMDAVANVNA